MEKENPNGVAKKGYHLFTFFFSALLNVVGFFLPPPFKRWTEYEMNYGVPNRKFDEADLIGLRRKGLISIEAFQNGFQYLGIEPGRAEKIYSLSEKLAGAGELVDLRLRNEIELGDYLKRQKQIGVEVNLAKELLKLTEKRFDPELVIRAWRRGISVIREKPDYFTDLKQQGWTDDRIDVLKRVTEFFPSPGDLIRFAVREVYTPAIVEKYGQMEDLPPKFLEEAQKAGLMTEQAKNYWAAHWILPSPSQGFEMFHRGVISYEELTTLLRTLDIMPFWRERLIKIAYTPYTRVDVRRMYKLGTLTRDEVKRSYLDLGYDDDKSEKMTDFCVKWAEEPEDAAMTPEEKRREELKGLTRGMILKRYKDGMIKQSEAESYLKDIGLTPEVIEFYISMADYNKEEEMVDGLIKSYRRMYINGVLDYNKITDLLDELNIPPKHRDYLLALWDLEILSKPSKPSKGELIKLAKTNIISEDIFKSEMSSLGYTTKYIDWYVKLNNLFAEV